ncbi:GntR family transcriptional regulator [Streptomyces sp. ISL-112]|uniref:GntR family transcriptional regulator n=1 Tax=unclassified Streptomyces TaxID=2593676 RepID=UPI001BE80308|nr:MULTISPECIES: GntR family transcriptional regulator [unclassified Streptomyces]MBT2429425.1 GntR family transcriptional regulator [Streptomyces sp. ISL-112]MBT2464017.1 GntR family transcriptional regulator [Streptomyces sp. ISL-63]
MAGSKPGYKEIADELRMQIERGKYQPGEKIPSQSALMAEFQAGRETVTKALRLLEDLGLTTTTQGRPAIVREFKPIRRPAVERLSKSVWGGGTSMWAVDVQDARPIVSGLEVASVEATPKVAEALGLRRGDPVVLRRRHYVLKGKPVLMADSYIPADLAQGAPIADEDTGKGGIYARLADIGHGPVRFKEEVRTRMPLLAEASLLRLQPGTPVICVLRSAFDEDGRTVEINDMVLDGGSYILDYVVDA